MVLGQFPVVVSCRCGVPAADRTRRGAASTSSVIYRVLGRSPGGNSSLLPTHHSLNRAVDGECFGIPDEAPDAHSSETDRIRPGGCAPRTNAPETLRQLQCARTPVIVILRKMQDYNKPLRGTDLNGFKTAKPFVGPILLPTNCAG